MSAASFHRLQRASLALLLAGAGACNKTSEKAKKTDAAEAKAGAEAKDAAEATDTAEAEAETDEPEHLDALLGYLAPDATAVTYDRLDQRLDPAVLSVVFALPPEAADLLEERETLDTALDIALDGEAEADRWLAPTTLAFVLPPARTPYFLRPLTKPAAEVEPLLDASGFTKQDNEDGAVWAPDGSFPWKVALLERGVAAFVPTEVLGTGLEALMDAREREPSAVEKELAGTLGEDAQIQLVLVAGGRLVHYDVSQPITQVQFALRRILGPQAGYEGQIVLEPSGDPAESSAQLRERSHPEETKQVQSLMSAVEFEVEDRVILGRLALSRDQLKHFGVR